MDTEYWQTIKLGATGVGHMVTHTGLSVDVLNPNPEAISIKDIAHHLSQINRFTGATTVPYSVAQHCLGVATLLPRRYKLLGLLHDSAEAYLNDLDTGLKRALPLYKDLENKMLSCILGKLAPRHPHELPPIVKAADTFMLAWEQYAFMPENSWWPYMLSDGDFERVEKRYGHLRAMPAKTAEALYLKWFDVLRSMENAGS